MQCLAILVSTVLILSCGQTDTQTDVITDVDDRYTEATTASISNNNDDFYGVVTRQLIQGCRITIVTAPYTVR